MSTLIRHLRNLVAACIKLRRKHDREQTDFHAKEYLKSQFRCPICGNLAGCSKEGEVSPEGAQIFQKHLEKCRESIRVKPGRIRYTGDEE